MTNWTEKAKALVGKRVRVLGCSKTGVNITGQLVDVLRASESCPGFVEVRNNVSQYYFVHARQCVPLKPHKPREEWWLVRYPGDSVLFVETKEKAEQHAKKCANTRVIKMREVREKRK